MLFTVAIGMLALEAEIMQSANLGFSLGSDDVPAEMNTR